jgi:hypothetical protein
VIVRLTQIDGKLPNLALMKLAHWHRARRDTVVFTRKVRRDMLEPAYDRVYASTIFDFSAKATAILRQEFPEAIVAGTGTADGRTVEDLIGENPYERYDYADWPDFTASIGFTQRGCRLRCKFCVVPAKEGKPRSVNEIAGIWRGEPWPRHLHLLDNDFFGQPEWEARLAEIREGGFKVCFNQGINVRLITDEVAAAIAGIQYKDDQFERPRLYTAWDNLKDEKVFFRGVDTLERAGIPPRHLLAYMLVGFAPGETLEAVEHRFQRMVARGIRPYPMVYDRSNRELRAFARWAIGRYYTVVPFSEYRVSKKGRPDLRQTALFDDQKT